jgi:hypothetical protein
MAGLIALEERGVPERYREELAITTDKTGMPAFFFSIAGVVPIGYCRIPATHRVFLHDLFQNPIGYSLKRREFMSRIGFGPEFFIAFQDSGDLATGMYA